MARKPTLDARQIIQRKQMNQQTMPNGRKFGFNNRNNLQVKARLGGVANNSRGGGGRIQKQQGFGRLNNKRFELTNRGIVRKPNAQRRINTSKKTSNGKMNPAKKVQLIGKKLIVTAKPAASVSMGGNGIPQRVINNTAGTSTVEDMEALENIRRAQILKQHLLQSFQERLPQSVFTPPLLPAPPKPASCALLVTNLHHSVTEDDVIELFSDVGLISSAKLGQPGTAVVVYHNAQDALRARDVYHNRQLDGIPMSCVLLPMNQTSTPARRNITSRLGGKLVLDTHTTSTIINNRNPMYRLGDNSDNVLFTVKLQ